MKKNSYIIKNKKAKLIYKLSERLEAGIVLTGSEVKSLRSGKANINNSYTKFKNGEAWLVGSHISEYHCSKYNQHEPERLRKLLLHKDEIRNLTNKTQLRSINLIPLSIYFKNGKAKIQLALAISRHLYDKRALIKKQDQNREIERAYRYNK